MNPALRQGQPLFTMSLLIHQLFIQHRLFLRTEVGFQLRADVNPPVETTGVGAARMQIIRRQMHFCQCFANSETVRRLRVSNMLTGQTLAENRGFVFQVVQPDITVIDQRGRHVQSAAAQMARQTHEVTHLIGVVMLEQCEYILTGGRGDEVVGVLNAGSDAFVRNKGTQIELGDKFCNFLMVQAGIYRHGVFRKLL